MFLRRSHSGPASDEELVAQTCSGDRAALGQLWDRYAQLLFGVGMKYLKDSERSKDLVVELFSDLPQLLSKHDVERFRPWLHAVMRNRCLLALRNERTTSALPEELLRAPHPEEQEFAILREAELQRLEQAIEELGEGQRLCIRLFYLERRSYQDVADATGYPVEQVRSHLQNGRRNLRLTLERHAQRS